MKNACKVVCWSVLVAKSSVSEEGPIVSTNSNPSSLSPGSPLQGGRYVVKKVLGQGGAGTAVLATDRRMDGKPVVIKELLSESNDPAVQQENARNFNREAVL